MTAPPDIAELLPYLPRRYPLPLIDRVIECVPGKSARGLKNVTMNEPFFSGHFPGYPVMPGVLVIESLIQLCAVLASASGQWVPDGTMHLAFPEITTCRFKRQVTPGDTLMLECAFSPEGTTLSGFTVRARVDGELAAEAALVARLVPVPGRDRGS